MKQLCYRISAKLFYEAKVNEAVSLVVEYFYKQGREQFHISNNDMEQINNVSVYIKGHAAFPLTLGQLCKMACMGQTKFYKKFKSIHGCTITEFIQQARIQQTEFLLSHINLSIAQVAQTIGYSNASRFAELFKRNIGVPPGKYRRIMR